MAPGTGASMGPRSYERGIARCLMLVGDALACFNGAAFLRTRNRVCAPRTMYCNFLASMGPRSYERGILSIDDAPIRRSQLQWGRVLTNAESTLIQLLIPAANSFNGAAFLRTRNPRYWAGKNLLLTSLQWGRVLTNAESTCWTGLNTWRTSASMGPRSYERGIIRGILTVMVVRERNRGEE